MEARAALRDDYVRPFRLAGTRVRGRLVRLGPEIARILDRHAYPDAAAAVLGESLAIAAALSQSLKAGGIFTLQVEGDGAIRRLVADIDATGIMRGFAGFDGAAGRAEAGSGPFGAGYLAFTFDPVDGGERYQGVVELAKGGLAQSVLHYFRQSEQIDTCLAAACGRRGGAWRAAALMLQRLPDDPGPAGGNRRSLDPARALHAHRRPGRTARPRSAGRRAAAAPLPPRRTARRCRAAASRRLPLRRPGADGDRAPRSLRRRDGRTCAGRTVRWRWSASSAAAPRPSPPSRLRRSSARRSPTLVFPGEPDVEPGGAEGGFYAEFPRERAVAALAELDEQRLFDPEHRVRVDIGSSWAKIWVTSRR